MTDPTTHEPDHQMQRADELIARAEAATLELEQNAPSVNRVHSFLAARVRQNNFGLEYELSFVRRGT